MAVVNGLGLRVFGSKLPFIFSSDVAAKVTQLTGQVSVLKDSTPWALQVGSVVQVRQVILTGGDGFAIFQVSDGSTFEVYPNSRVVFRANPSNLKDLLDLVLGRVKVHIQKLGGQPNNNRVTTPTAVIPFAEPCSTSPSKIRSPRWLRWKKDSSKCVMLLSDPALRSWSIRESPSVCIAINRLPSAPRP